MSWFILLLKYSWLLQRYLCTLFSLFSHHFITFLYLFHFYGYYWYIWNGYNVINMIKTFKRYLLLLCQTCDIITNALTNIHYTGLVRSFREIERKNKVLSNFQTKIMQSKCWLSVWKLVVLKSTPPVNNPYQSLL